MPSKNPKDAAKRPLIASGRVGMETPRRQENQASGGIRTSKLTHHGWEMSLMVMVRPLPPLGAARDKRRSLQVQESGPHASADDDLEGRVEFFAVPEFFQGGVDFRFDLRRFFGDVLFG